MPTNTPAIVITGCGGYIGSHAMARLARRYPVVGLDLNRPAAVPRGAQYVECDLTRDSSVRQAFDDVRSRFGDRLAGCIHLAAYYDFSGGPSPLYDQLTVQGTARLLRELKQFTTQQFIFSSTLLVMKAAEEERQTIRESSPVAPAWDYPRSKLRAENVIREDHGDIPFAILRIAGVYDEDCHSIPLAQQISRIHQKKLESYFFPGDADHGQPFIHIDDLTDCIERTVELRAKLAAEETFLIAEPDVVSYAVAQDRIGELIHGKEWPAIRVPKVVAKAGAWVGEKLAGEDEEAFIKPWMVDLADDHYPVAIDHARSVLGWQPIHRLRETFPEMITRLKSNPVRWYEENNLPVPDEIRAATEEKKALGPR